MANHVCEIALIDGPLAIPRSAAVAGAGAIIDFCGNVRPWENDAPISGIDYEAHRAMAEHQLRAIGHEAAERFGLLALKLQHRFGFVPTGETSLHLRVAAAHRQEAFAAGQWIVDELKKRVPIWKKPAPTPAAQPQ